VKEKEQPPMVCAFFVGLEETVGAELRALVQHLNHYGRDIFTKIGREHDLDAAGISHNNKLIF